MTLVRRCASLFALSLLFCIALPGSSYAATPYQEKGLLITPLRQYLSIDAGKSLDSSLTIANLTDGPLIVNLSVKQFSVANYTYDYKFTAPPNDWIHLSTNSFTLPTHKTMDVPYSVDVPAGSTPGGHYYTLFASANLSSQGINNTVQAADLLYLTVNGQLTSVSHLQDSSIQWLSFGKDIPFTLQPVNTGNVHTFVYVSGQLHGLFVKPPQTSSGHLLMPEKVRTLQGSIPSPILPGIYQAVYGYKTDAGWVIQQQHWVVFIPPWSIAFVLAALLVGSKYLTRTKKQAE